MNGFGESTKADAIPQRPGDGTSTASVSRFVRLRRDGYGSGYGSRRRVTTALGTATASVRLGYGYGDGSGWLRRRPTGTRPVTEVATKAWEAANVYRG